MGENSVAHAFSFDALVCNDEDQHACANGSTLVQAGQFLLQLCLARSKVAQGTAVCPPRDASCLYMQAD